MAKTEILDAFGRPIRRESLTVEVAGPTLGGVRSPISGYPADGLNPERLASILKEADIGEPVRYLELAETIEERDPHYLGVIGTRRRSVAQLDITVEAGSEDPEDEKIAQMVRDYIDRDELAGQIFDILDCIPKGYSVTEVVYDLSEGQYMPRLIHRDPRYFRFDRRDLKTPMLPGKAANTYDNTPEIDDLYKTQARYTFDVNYSVQTKRLSSELLISSPDLFMPFALDGRKIA